MSEKKFSECRLGSRRHIGWSPTRRSTAACRLDWDVNKVAWSIERFRASETERSDVLRRVANQPHCGSIHGRFIRFRDNLPISHCSTTPHAGIAAAHWEARPGQHSCWSTPQFPCQCLRQSCSRHVSCRKRCACPRHPCFPTVEAFPSSSSGVLIRDPLALGVLGANARTVPPYLAQSGGLLRARYDTYRRATPRAIRGCGGSHDERALCGVRALRSARVLATTQRWKRRWLDCTAAGGAYSVWAWNILTENARVGGLEWRGSSPAHLTGCTCMPQS